MSVPMSPRVPANLADPGQATAVLKSATVTGDGTWVEVVFEVDAEPVSTQTLEVEVAAGHLRAPADYSLTDPVGPSLGELVAARFRWALPADV